MRRVPAKLRTPKLQRNSGRQESTSVGNSGTFFAELLDRAANLRKHGVGI